MLLPEVGVFLLEVSGAALLTSEPLLHPPQLTILELKLVDGLRLKQQGEPVGSGAEKKFKNRETKFTETLTGTARSQPHVPRSRDAHIDGAVTSA